MPVGVRVGDPAGSQGVPHRRADVRGGHARLQGGGSGLQAAADDGVPRDRLGTRLSDRHGRARVGEVPAVDAAEVEEEDVSRREGVARCGHEPDPSWGDCEVIDVGAFPGNEAAEDLARVTQADPGPHCVDRSVRGMLGGRGRMLEAGELLVTLDRPDQAEQVGAVEDLGSGKTVLYLLRDRGRKPVELEPDTRAAEPAPTDRRDERVDGGLVPPLPEEDGCDALEILREGPGCAVRELESPVACGLDVADPALAGVRGHERVDYEDGVLAQRKDGEISMCEGA